MINIKTGSILPLNATSEVGKILNKNNTVIFESTVYPGCTDQVHSLLEKYSDLKLNLDFIAVIRLNE